jgi:hypothetical protein
MADVRYVDRIGSATFYALELDSGIAVDIWLRDGRIEIVRHEDFPRESGYTADEIAEARALLRELLSAGGCSDERVRAMMGED